MARATDKSWLVDGVERARSNSAPTRKRKAQGGKGGVASEWLKVPRPGRQDRSKADDSSKRSKSVRALQSKLSELETELARAKRREQELRRDLERASMQNGGTSSDASAGAGSKAAPRANSKSRSRAAPGPKRSGTRASKPEINSVTFEQLRELGLSVNESARLIAARETRGGFESLADVDELPGFSRETRDRLKRELRAPRRRKS